MLNKLNKIFTKEFAAICAAMLGLSYVFYDIFSTISSGKATNYFYYMADLFFIVLLFLFSYYTFTGRSRKASKTYYVIAGFSLIYTALFSYASIEIGISFIQKPESFGGIGYGLELLCYGLGAVCLSFCVAFFLAYKLGNKPRIWLTYIAIILGLLSFIIAVTGFCAGIAAMLETESSTIVNLFDNVNTALLALVFMSHSVLTMNRFDDFDENNLKDKESL